MRAKEYVFSSLRNSEIRIQLHCQVVPHLLLCCQTIYPWISCADLRPAHVLQPDVIGCALMFPFVPQQNHDQNQKQKSPLLVE